MDYQWSGTASQTQLERTKLEQAWLGVKENGDKEDEEEEPKKEQAAPQGEPQPSRATVYTTEGETLDPSKSLSDGQVTEKNSDPLKTGSKSYLYT